MGGSRKRLMKRSIPGSEGIAEDGHRGDDLSRAGDPIIACQVLFFVPGGKSAFCTFPEMVITVIRKRVFIALSRVNFHCLVSDLSEERAKRNWPILKFA